MLILTANVAVIIFFACLAYEPSFSCVGSPGAYDGHLLHDYNANIKDIFDLLMCLINGEGGKFFKI